MASKVAERVRRHREDLRAAGLRPIQIWVPDECRRQSAALRDDPHEAATLEWLDAAADRGGWR